MSKRVPFIVAASGPNVVSAPRLTVCSFPRRTKTGMTWEDFDRLTCRSRSEPTLDGTWDVLVASRMAFVPSKAASFHSHARSRRGWIRAIGDSPLKSATPLRRHTPLL